MLIGLVRSCSILEVTALALVGIGCGSGSSDVAPAPWPKQVTLHTDSVTGGPGIRLSDGVIVMDQGDFNLGQAMVLSLRSPTAESFCTKEKYGALADVPTEESACTGPNGAQGGGWTPIVYLSGSGVHTSDESYYIGLGVLARDASHQKLYRLRILGDSYDAQGHSTATFEYEPVR